MQTEPLAQRLAAHVQTLAGDIGPRHDGDPASLDAAVDYLTEQWRDQGQAVEVQTYPTPRGDARNLVVEWPGTTRTDEIVIVGAHYDTVPTTPGADDNASAVAGLLETARGLHALRPGRRFERTLRFVAFANEEPPHFVSPTMGSRVYAGRCRAAGDTVHAMVCLEMIGFHGGPAPDGDALAAAGFPRELAALLPDHSRFIAAVGDENTADRLTDFARAFRAATDYPLVAHADAANRRHFWLSDHGPFWDLGMPALMVTDTSFVRNPHYHRGSDLPDTLDYAAMADVVTGVVAGVARLADA